MMGSPYLIAHGRGIRVADATAKVTVPQAGRWRVWVRSRKWVDGAGRFKVVVGGRELERIFGASQKEWAWEDGGDVTLPAGEIELRLVDLDGFDGRMAGVVLSRGGKAP
ncbi:MAG: NADH-dependent oxidoreductase, partial [Clostridia bacterium]|nr:NADH-dependent oxidoreductase [Clostridia bacterium]